jgi:hypothetical protein
LELLARQRLDPTGALEPLTPSELSNAFTALRLGLPESFGAVEKETLAESNIENPILLVNRSRVLRSTGAEAGPTSDYG